MSGGSAVDLVLLWHHHQPDYRDPRTGRALLPWVRLHATKDYLDMALRLEPWRNVRVAFNFVPSLLDQIEAAASGGSDALFDLLARPPAELDAAERATVAARCTAAPRHALERWPAYRRLVEKSSAARRVNGAASPLGDDELLALEIWFLLAWLDPLFLGGPEVQGVLSHAGAFTLADRDALLGLHDLLLAQVVPAYRALAEDGRIELSASPYDHPILPLLVDVQAARRARPDLPLPSEPFAAPEDAERQIALGLERHARAFGARPAGMWPPEGSVSPEAVELAARAGVRWLASDEGVLWASLTADQRRREALYRPWRFATPAGEVTLFFRDHELSDRIGFVYQHWEPAAAVADFLGRVRRVGREHRGEGTPVVSVILDGENCWESYAEDGGPFLDRLYEALDKDPEIRTRTPSEVLARPGAPSLRHLHSGSWINADYRIWIGHPEKNRAWDLLARARRALAEREAAGSLPAGGEGSDGDPRLALYAAEGSDWFWWFGDDHYTADKSVFDRLFREHLKAVYERIGTPVPGWLEVPIAGALAPRLEAQVPVRFLSPTLDGRRTGFYEWHAAGRFALSAGGGSMHRDAGVCRDLYYGFDADTLFLRVDFEGGVPGAEADLALELLSPRPAVLRVRGLEPGERPIEWQGGEPDGAPVAGARCRIDEILELGVPFASLGLERGERVEMIGRLMREGRSVETLPADQLVRFQVPDESFEASMWCA